MNAILKQAFETEMQKARVFYKKHEYRAPVGNTGGANVGILTPMPIPEDLAAVFRAAGVAVYPDGT